jgi:hypothetical protein
MALGLFGFSMKEDSLRKYFHPRDLRLLTLSEEKKMKLLGLALLILSWNIFPILGSQLILFLLGWLPLQFWRDQSRDLPWSVHHFIFLFQSLLLPLSFWAFYGGLQGPLPLESLSDGSRLGHGSLLLIYALMVCFHSLPPDLPRPSFPWKKSSYSYSFRLHMFLCSRENLLWERLLDLLLSKLLEDSFSIRVLARLDTAFRQMLPLSFLSLSLGGVFCGDLSWLLWAQPLMLLSLVYRHALDILGFSVASRIDFLESILQVKPPCSGSSLWEFSWRHGDFSEHPEEDLDYYVGVWQGLKNLGILLRHWKKQEARALRLMLAGSLSSALVDPTKLLGAGLLGRALARKTPRPSMGSGPRDFSSHAYGLKEGAEKNRVIKESQGGIDGKHPVSGDDLGQEVIIYSNLTSGTGTRKFPSVKIPSQENVTGQSKPQRVMFLKEPLWLPFLEGRAAKKYRAPGHSLLKPRLKQCLTRGKKT